MIEDRSAMTLGVPDVPVDDFLQTAMVNADCEYVSRSFQGFGEARPLCHSPATNESADRQSMAVSGNPWCFPQSTSVLPIEFVRPNQGTIVAHDGILFEPVQLLHKNLQINLISPAQVMT